MKDKKVKQDSKEFTQFTEFMDGLERAFVTTVMAQVNSANLTLKLNYKEARNMVGKVGARIVFGKSTDKIIFEK